ncbi:putative bifunctional dTTP/UTP pyrophosphatase/methyltransferase protein isoform X2 [Nelusetta ayraudi]|uniref:putative bifunctional dTTP/UTP pyrophosphatase/methyltransferase protein isoform X2 n=1 Tax=Nelusetta ayraudi TaxID=303726 RepID=UPI003F72EEE8
MVLNPVISKLVGKLVVLASASPRRMEILRNVGLRFEVVPSRFKETLDKSQFKTPQQYAVETAKQKALEVAKRMPFQHLKIPHMVIGADTIVSVDGKILEKPVDKKDAYRMLSSLSGKEHSVYTGVALVFCHEKENEVDYQLFDFYEETKVKFADLSESMLWEYIDSGEPMDKAGGYGIQALGGMLVESVHGDFLNVVGFPLNHFCRQLDLLYNGSKLSSSDSHSTLILSQPSPDHGPGSSCKRSPPASPAHKVKINSEQGDGSRTPVNSLSNKTSPGKSAETRRAMPLNVTEQEEREPKREELQRIIQLMEGFKASKALFTASNVGLFDVLRRRPELDAAEVAQELKASVRGTERLLEACVSLGLLKSKERPSQTPVYKNTSLSKRFLLSDTPFSLRGYIQHCDKTVWPLFSHLEEAVQEGSNQHQRAFGKTSEDLFQDAVYNNQEAKLRFMGAMHSIARVTGKAVATAFDLSRFKTACDLGGCTGALAYEFTKAHPELTVTVFDLPAVVDLSEHFHPRHTDNRVSFVAGDFFKDDLPKADLYILARVLHDWSDEKVNILLNKIAEACTPGCAVLVAETILDRESPYAALQSLNMLVQTEGRERTKRQYADLLRQHGFGAVRTVQTSNFLDAFMARKV